MKKLSKAKRLGKIKKASESVVEHSKVMVRKRKMKRKLVRKRKMKRKLKRVTRI